MRYSGILVGVFGNLKAGERALDACVTCRLVQRAHRVRFFQREREMKKSLIFGAAAMVLALGATRHVLQPGGNWRVYVDPVGHPFCLCWD